jgi:c-di-GMP-binding flagellar brake protein YcgR
VLLDGKMTHQRKESARISIPLHVEFKTSKDSTDYSTGITNNISRNGMCFDTQRIEIGPRDTIELRLKMPLKERFYNILGEFVWKKQGKNKCRVGIRIRKMDKEIETEILDYASKIWDDVEKRARYKQKIILNSQSD